jgi:plastocyanin
MRPDHRLSGGIDVRRLRRLGIVVSLAALTVLLLTGCSRPVESTAPTPNPVPTSGAASITPDAVPSHQLIVVTEKGFQPASVAIKVGTNVIWSNSDTKTHSVVLSKDTESGPIKPGGTAQHVFDKAGTYKYRDGSNPSLTGTVIVK